MKKLALLPSLLALLAVLLAVLFLALPTLRTRRPGFMRLSFSCSLADQELRFDEKIFKWRGGERSDRLLSKGVSRGTGMIFKDRGQLTLKPGVRGEKGFLLALQVNSWDGQEISITAGVKSGGSTRAFAEFKSEDGYRLISRTLRLRPWDEIVILARGSGTVIAGEPVIYDRIARPERKYIFLIAPDTFRGDRVGKKRGGRSLTPHIDGFKADAVTFANSFAQSSWTLPSFVCLFTGLYEHHHQVMRRDPLAPGMPFLSKILSPDFVTANIHGGGWMSVWAGFSAGMDYCAQKSNPKQQDGGRRMFAAAVDFLSRNPVPSLFMFLHTYQVHDPYAPPKEFLRLLNERPRHSLLASFHGKKQFFRQAPPELARDMEELYDGEVMAFDHYFGEFIGHLKSLGIYDQSLIVFLSDHGEEFHEHGGWGHGHSLYEEIIKVPLLIKFPGNRSSGRVIERNTALIDVLPTLLDCFGMGIPAGLDGSSLLPLLERTDGPERVFRRRELFSSMACKLKKSLPMKFAIIFQRQKLIFNYPFSRMALDFYAKFGLPPAPPEIELYDLGSDPRETVNLFQGKDALPVSVQRAIDAMAALAHPARRQGTDGDAGLAPEEREQLETLGYL